MMLKYSITLNNEELICLKQALLIASSKFNDKAEHACKLKNSIMEEFYKKRKTKVEKLFDKLNNLK